GGHPVASSGVRGAKVLVVSDVVPFPGDAQRAIERLRSAGFVVLGNYPGQKGEEADLQEQLNVEASVKGVRGLAPLSASDVRAALCSWVSGQEGLSLLVWFSREDPAKPAVQANIFGPRLESGRGREALDAGVRAVRGG